MVITVKTLPYCWLSDVVITTVDVKFLKNVQSKFSSIEEIWWILTEVLDEHHDLITISS